MSLGRRRNPRTSGDRRGTDRASLGGLFINKYIDGVPHLATLLDLSPSGMMLRKVLEPAAPRGSFAIELGIPWTEERLWLWARCIRDLGDRQALRFEGATDDDKAQLEAIVREARRSV